MRISPDSLICILSTVYIVYSVSLNKQKNKIKLNKIKNHVRK